MNHTKKFPSNRKLVKFVTSLIKDFFDPAGFLFPPEPKDEYYLYPADIDRLIRGFVPGLVEDSGWGDLIVDHCESGYRLWASVPLDWVVDTYCDINHLDRYSNDWPIALASEGWTWIYHQVAHFVPHTYMDRWTDSIVRQDDPAVNYITRAARQYHRNHG